MLDAFSTKLGGSSSRFAAANAEWVFLGGTSSRCHHHVVGDSAGAVAHQPFSVPHPLNGQFIHVRKRMFC
jgi:hypothetical protein